MKQEDIANWERIAESEGDDFSLSLLAAVKAERARADAAIAELANQRMCVTCGQYAPAGAPKTYENSACTGPDGMNPCCFDLTPTEAWQHWRNEWHAQLAQLEAERATVARLREALEHIKESLRESPCGICLQTGEYVYAALTGKDGAK